MIKNHSTWIPVQGTIEGHIPTWCVRILVYPALTVDCPVYCSRFRALQQMMEDALKKSTEVKDQKITLLENKLKEAQERQQVRLLLCLYDMDLKQLGFPCLG